MKYNITNLCYDLYKEDWLSNHINTNSRKNALRDWYLETDTEDREYYTFADYIDENGYCGELYVCYDEFMENEFLDKDYMQLLLAHNTDLQNEYNKYVCANT